MNGNGHKEGKEELDVPFYGAVSEQNCHPFRHQQFTFMHNGGLSGFDRVKRTLINMLKDYIFGAMDGNTDSEYCFGVFLTLAREQYDAIQARQVDDENNPTPLSQMRDMDFLASTTKATIERLLEVEYEAGINSASSLNFAISDGVNVVATRCRNDTVQVAPSLYYCYGYCGRMSNDGTDLKIGSCAECEKRRLSGDVPTNVIVSSEPVTKKSDGWKLVPQNAMICIEGDPDRPGVIRSVTIRELKLNPTLMRENGRRSRSKMLGRYATRVIDEAMMQEPKRPVTAPSH